MTTSCMYRILSSYISFFFSVHTISCSLHCRTNAMNSSEPTCTSPNKPKQPVRGPQVLPDVSDVHRNKDLRAFARKTLMIT